MPNSFGLHSYCDNVTHLANWETLESERRQASIWSVPGTLWCAVILPMAYTAGWGGGQVYKSSDYIPGQLLNEEQSLQLTEYVQGISGCVSINNIDYNSPSWYGDIDNKQKHTKWQHLLLIGKKMLWRELKVMKGRKKWPLILFKVLLIGCIWTKTQKGEQTTQLSKGIMSSVSSTIKNIHSNALIHRKCKNKGW